MTNDIENLDLSQKTANITLSGLFTSIIVDELIRKGPITLEIHQEGGKTVQVPVTLEDMGLVKQLE